MLTTDAYILDMVQHAHLKFNNPVSQHQGTVEPYNMPEAERQVIDREISKLLELGVITVSQGNTDNQQFLSNVFVRPKKNGSYRMILNLKELNVNVEYKKFKMDTLESIVKLIRQDCYMGSLDLKNAYYTVPVADSHQAYLRFPWRSKSGEVSIYQFTCLPNGLASAPRDFTKLLKPLLAYLRLQGVIIVAYIDDTYIQGESYTECKANVLLAQNTFEKLGFVINQEKSVFEPSKQLTMLGFVLNSETMTVTLTDDKKQRIKSMCKLWKENCSGSIKDLAKLIGSLVASLPGVEYGPLHYRDLEVLKTDLLRVHKGNFNKRITLNSGAQQELSWWVNNVDKATKRIHHGKPSLLLRSDASKKGWGASFEGLKAGGRWSQLEMSEHINVLETKAIFFALKSMCSSVKNTHLRVEVDNATAVCYINAMGGVRSPKCNDIAKQIWAWCIERNIWLSAAHIAGVKNVEADEASRVFNDRIEWELAEEVFTKLVSDRKKPDIDLFANRLNAKLPRYVSWKPDPEATFFDAFTICWSDYSFYAFPPFSLISTCLQKIAEDNAEGILIAPVWPTQVWFSTLMGMLMDHPRILPQNAVQNPLAQQQIIPRMMACPVSGNNLKTKAFRQQLQPSSWRAGEGARRSNMGQCIANGMPFVTNRKLVRLLPL